MVDPIPASNKNTLLLKSAQFLGFLNFLGLWASEIKETSRHYFTGSSVEADFNGGSDSCMDPDQSDFNSCSFG